MFLVKNTHGNITKKASNKLIKKIKSPALLFRQHSLKTTVKIDTVFTVKNIIFKIKIHGICNIFKT